MTNAFIKLYRQKPITILSYNQINVQLRAAYLKDRAIEDHYMKSYK